MLHAMKFRIVIVTVVIALGCRTAGSGGSGGTVLVDERTSSDPAEILDRGEERRVIGLGFASLVVHTDSQVRQALARLMGRIRDPKGSGILISLLRDSDSQVRREAAFASGLLGDFAPAELNTTLLEKLGEAENRDVLIEAVGRVGGPGDISRVAGFLLDSAPIVRGTAARAVGYFGGRGMDISKEVLDGVAQLLSDESGEVQLMGVFALGQTSWEGIDDGNIRKALVTAGRDLEGSDSEVRALAWAAIGRNGGLRPTEFEMALEDPDPRIGIVAVRSLESMDEGSRCHLALLALDGITEYLTRNPDRIRESYGGLVRTSLEIAATCPANGEIRRRGKLIEEAVGGAEEPFHGGVALTRCLARLVAGADNMALLSCDPKRSETGKKMVMRRLFRHERTSMRDLKIISEMVDDSNMGVATTAIGVLGQISKPMVLGKVVDTLGGDRIPVVTATLETIASFPDNFRHPENGQYRAVDGLMEAIERTIVRFLPFQHTHAPLISAAHALGALSDPAAGPLLHRLVADTRPPVRWGAMDAILEIEGVDVPPGLPPLAVSSAIGRQNKNRIRASEATAIVMTSRGSFALELYEDTAPFAVASFLTLARNGFYDDTVINRVQPQFVVQGGDPTGTGFGDGGYCVPSEPGHRGFKRGTVGMAMWERDGVGSQFFITLSRALHLDGKFTVLGRITSGLEVAELLEVGDRVTEVIVKVK
jgi:cyclophilin family peptidyl-prolyl cis-trans isomerase/HEAT repeat protein